MAVQGGSRTEAQTSVPDDTALPSAIPSELMRPASDPSALRVFLEHPSRPAGTLTYHELQGFLFTIVSAPEAIPLSEWMPIIFAEGEAGYSNLDEAKRILGQIMALYNTTNAAVTRTSRAPGSASSETASAIPSRSSWAWASDVGRSEALNRVHYSYGSERW